VLLTATPLQNSLMELYGLVSVIDEHFFGDQGAFRSAYVNSGTANTGLLFLRKRLETICKRTLRRQVQQTGLIKYTERCPCTISFEPGDDEIQLYSGVSSYLQRPGTIGFRRPAKRIGHPGSPQDSWLFDIRRCETLARIIERLKDKQPPSIESLVDYDVIDEEAEELEEEEEPFAQILIDPVKLAEEIAELEGYRALALKIGKNAKGHELVSALPQAMQQIVEKGGQRKAVIFTESVRTQGYLADLLTASGYADDIVLLNGQNSDPSSQALYRSWLARHRGTDAISGSKTADMKAAWSRLSAIARPC